MLDFNEMKKDFEAEFGREEVEEKYPITPEQYKELCVEAGILQEIENMSAEYVQESVEHFLSSKSFDLDDETRYFYNNREMKDFLKGYLKGKGDLADLCCYFCKDAVDELLCYEVFRSRYFNDIEIEGDKALNIVRIAERLGVIPCA